MIRRSYHEYLNLLSLTPSFHLITNLSPSLTPSQHPHYASKHDYKLSHIFSFNFPCSISVREWRKIKPLSLTTPCYLIANSTRVGNTCQGTERDFCLIWVTSFTHTTTHIPAYSSHPPTGLPFQ